MNNEVMDLALRIATEDRCLSIGRPCLIEVSLFNNGDKPLVVNTRMAVGYREHIARELFADLIDLSTGAPAEFWPIDYNREFSPLSDYISLDQGDAISTTFDLFDWYAPNNQGTYQLTLFYQADEELASKPPEVVRGTVRSNPIILEVVSDNPE